jgi:hypothetical protein
VSGHFIKRYASASARNRAETNYRWLTRLQGPAHLPELRYSGERELCFEHVEGRHAVPADLAMLAAHLGDIHGSLGALDALTAIARGHQNHDIQLVQYGHSTLQQLRTSG